MKHKFLELLASMRFAVSLLSILAIASVIGTVLPQEQATINYINQFGPFWAKLFSQLGLNRIYSAIWFLLILFFLVCSTSLCIIRNAPRMIADMRSWRDHIRKKALFNFHHKAIWTSPLSSASLLNQLTDALKRQGYQVKSTHRTEAILISAKKGRFNKLGYLAAHGAIVMICLGGLLDSDLFIRTQEWWFKKVPFNGELILGKVPTQHLLGIYNPSFRGNMLVAEGASSHFAIINRDQGVLLQELPFSIHLKKFIIEHYSTGVPKLFASEVEITDRETQKKFSNVIKVNHPLIYKGMAVYQSSFEDGGSALELTGYNMRGNQDSVFKVTGIVGEKTSLEQVQAGKEKFMLEWSGFRPFNIEDLNNITENSQQKKLNLFTKIFNENLGAAVAQHKKKLHNLGPSVQYKLRDQNGLAREFNHYMLPIDLEGERYFLAGMRESEIEEFRYLRIPADQDDSLTEWMRLRAALADPKLRLQAVEKFTSTVVPAASGEWQQQVRQSALRTMELFAGDENSLPEKGGYLALAKFLERLPAKEQEQVAVTLLKMLQGSLWQLWQLARTQDGQNALTPNEQNLRFLRASMNALSDQRFYHAAVYLQLTSFNERKASVFQITRSPGKPVVYIGFLLLVLGIAAMFYISERRAWVWLEPLSNNTDNSTEITFAITTQRRTLEFEKEFVRLLEELGAHS